MSEQQNCSQFCPLDLEAEKQKVKKQGWVNIYTLGQSDIPIAAAFVASFIYRDETIANENALSERIACVRIEWEEEVSQ